MLTSTKTTKLHELVGQVQFVVFENFTSAYYKKLHGKILYHLLIMYMIKHLKTSQKVKTDKI